MADSHSETPVQASSGGQNTIVIILLALMILVGTLVVLNMRGQNEDTSQADRLDQLQQRVKQKEDELRAQGFTIPNDNQSLDKIADRISRDALSLKASAEELQMSLSAKDSELNKMRAELEASLSMLEKQGAEATNLRTQLAQLQNQQGQLSLLNQQVIELQTQLAEKNKQIMEFGSRPNADEYLELNKQLNTVLLKNKELENKVAELTSVNNSMISPNEVQSLKDQINKLNPENEALKLTVQKLRAQLDRETLYVKSADNLQPAAAKLYRELEKLEGLNEEQLKSAYTRISEQLNARVIKDVRFQAGDSTVGFSDTVNIRDRLMNISPDSSLLIVGYASKTGDINQNRELSAQRSATTASVVHHLLDQKGHIQAVYLGQTTRFSTKAEDNQICEIWEIRK